MSLAAATFPRFRTVGFVGARRLVPAEAGRDEADVEAGLRRRIDEVLERLQRGLRPRESLSAVSALAVGADTVFAEAVAGRGIWHQVFLPQAPDGFFRIEDFFDSPERLARSRRLLDGSNVIEVRLASEALERNGRFSECGYHIALECDVLVGVVREDEEGKPGGTRETLAYARSIGRPVVEISLGGDLAPRGLEEMSWAGSDDEAFGWPLPAPAGAEPLAEVTALGKQAGAEANRHKSHFRNSNGFVLSTHVAATLVAAWSLADLPHGIATKVAKALLLLVGIAVYFLLHHVKPQRRWVRGRLIAELCRSVRALRRLPGHLGYLGSFEIPGCRELVRSLTLLHLRATRDLVQPPADFVGAYLRERIGEDGAPAGASQLGYYARQAARARRIRAWLEGAFYVFSILALGCAIGYVLRTVDEAHAPAWERFAFWFAPATFPVIAAAAASWVSILDLDRRASRYEGMVGYLRVQREVLARAPNDAILRKAVHRIEQTLLQEVVEWHAKHLDESSR